MTSLTFAVGDTVWARVGKGGQCPATRAPQETMWTGKVVGRTPVVHGKHRRWLVDFHTARGGGQAVRKEVAGRTLKKTAVGRWRVQCAARLHAWK